MHGGCEGTLLLRQELPQDEPTRRLRSPLQGLTPSRSGDEQSNQRASRYGHRRGNQATRSNVLVIRRETKKNSCTISDVSFTTTFGIKPRVQLEFWGNRKFFEEITNPPQKTNRGHSEDSGNPEVRRNRIFRLGNLSATDDSGLACGASRQLDSP